MVSCHVRIGDGWNAGANMIHPVECQQIFKFLQSLFVLMDQDAKQAVEERERAIKNMRKMFT